MDRKRRKNKSLTFIPALNTGLFYCSQSVQKSFPAPAIQKVNNNSPFCSQTLVFPAFTPFLFPFSTLHSHLSLGGFAALGGGNVGEGIWKGALSGFVGGGVGSYIGGGWGAFTGGATSGGLSAALYGGDAEDIATGALIGGAVAWGGYQAQQGVAYKQYNKGSKPLGDLTRQGLRKISVASQRSFARGREAGGWILNNGDVGNVAYGKKAGVNLPSKPGNAIANFHTHPNDPRYIQYHSLTDLVGENNVNYVIARSNIYRHDPNTHPLPNNYSAFSQQHIYNTLIPSMITTYPNSMNLYPFYWHYFGR